MATTISTTALARATAAFDKVRKAEAEAKKAKRDYDKAVAQRRLEVARLMAEEQTALRLDDAQFLAHMRGLVKAADEAAEEAKRKREARKQKQGAKHTVQPPVQQGVPTPASGGNTPDREGGR